MAVAPLRLIKSLLKILTFKRVLVLTLGLLVFLADNENLTSASSFENRSLSGVARKGKTRLPSDVAAKPTVNFDCNTSLDKIEINTDFENIRLMAANCKDKVVWENTRFNNKLLTFPLDKKTYSSEFAYLSRGENTFVITSGKKSVKLSVFRF